MSRSTISTFKLFELFPDEPSARKYLEGRLWLNGVTCPECQGKDRITVRKDAEIEGVNYIIPVNKA